MAARVPPHFCELRATRGAYGFAIGAYDHSRSLVVDPGLVYSTYLGGDGFQGQGNDFGHSVAADDAGNAYVTGTTYSSTFPTTEGAFDTTANGARDAFVTKLNAAGSDLVYSTYLGGGSVDEGRSIVVDASGSAYVTGSTESGNFPTTPGAFDRTLSGDADGYATKLDPTGSTLVYSTFLGGTDNDSAAGIAVDADDSAYVAGSTYSNDFPPTNRCVRRPHGQLPPVADAFVTKLNDAGSALVYLRRFGGHANDFASGIAVDGTETRT